MLRPALMVVVLALAWLFLRRLRFDQVGEAMRGADWRLVLVAALLNIGPNTAVRVLRWWILVRGLPRPAGGARPLELASLHFASCAAANLLPARFNEVLRVAALHRRHGYRVGALVASQLVERAFDAFSQALLALAALSVVAAPPRIRGALWGYVGIGTAVMLPLILVRLLPAIARPAPPPPSGRRGSVRRLAGHARALFGQMIAAFRSLLGARSFVAVLACSLAADLCDAVMLGLCLAAVGAPLHPVPVLMAFVTINVLTIVPLTPAQVGVAEVAAVSTLSAFGLSNESALAAGILYHCAHVLSIMAVGLPLLRGELKRSGPAAVGTDQPGTSLAAVPPG